MRHNVGRTPKGMATEILDSVQMFEEFIEQHPIDSKLLLRNVTWDEYERMLDYVSDPAGLRMTYDNGTLQIMTTSAEHERYTRFFETLCTIISLRRRINIISVGSATMRKRPPRQGNEPDASFYVQSAPLIGNRRDIDFEVDPPPDIAVEIDLHRDSISKFSIYAALGVSELWRYDGVTLRIDLLEGEDYVPASQSRSLPILTNKVLTDFLTQFQQTGEFETLIEFEQWVQQQTA
jgi:Uma2 family endonuclease